MEKEIVVDVKDVSKIYESESGRTRVLDKVNVSIKKGEFVGIVGDSGSGKTTLLNLVGGMDSVSSGTITVAGDVISRYNDQQRTAYRRRRVGFIDKFLDVLKLKEKKNAFPMQLSGGEQQRAAVLRSLLSEPDIILADEPTGNLDSKNTQMVVKLLQQFSNKMGKTILFVTHNMALTKSCDRVIVVKDGKIVNG